LPRPQHGSEADDVAARDRAELPQFARGSLVAVDQVIELEGVDLAAVVARESFTHVLDQIRKPRLVITGDERSCGPSTCLLIAHATSFSRRNGPF
jgi:hypothetical protein